MTGWRALVVEDVPLMRAALATILRSHRAISLVDEADRIGSATELIARQSYDAVFLDVHLPDGFGVELGRIAYERGVPAIVYCTADPSFAVDAFRQEAVDYLAQPRAAGPYGPSDRLGRAAKGTRLARSEIACSTKNPLILPNRSPATAV